MSSQSLDDTDSKCTHMPTTLSCISHQQRTVMCRSWSRVGDINRWMCANRLKLNQDKTQFIWHQLSKLRLLTIMLGSVNIKISTEAMCLGVLLDRVLTFAPHVCLARVFTICGR